MHMALDVKVFQTACDQNRSEENASLYRRLINEEYNEFLEAYQDNDEVEQLDACMDMIWVILGYCYMKNFQVHGAWNEVAKSNLSKIDRTTGKVIKREDGKVLKPEGWRPPDLGSYANKKLAL